jgi:glycosyltransferase involved in cell wall biosynthesis
MLVGIRGSGLSAEAGGGYTFEREVFDELCRIAADSRHRFVALGGLRPSPAVRERPPNLDLPAAPGLAQRLAWRITRSGPEGELRRNKVDLVWNLGQALPATDVPFLTIVWDLQHRLQPFFPEVSAGGEWAARERLFGTSLRRAAGVIVGTEVGRIEVASFYGVPGSRIHVLPHPTPGFALADLPDPPGVLDRFGLPERFLLYPAQFWPHKNHVNLLRAMRILIDRGADLSLVLVGSDKGTGPLVRAVTESLGLSSRVRPLGFVTTVELVALYRRTLALAYVSLFGPENLPPLEAFALGCPVVAADVPGSEEQLVDAALRVDATKPEELAEAIRRLVTEPPLRDQLVRRGRELAHQRACTSFVRGVFEILDGLEPYFRCWRPEGGR